VQIVEPFDRIFDSEEIAKLQALYNTHKRVHPLIWVALHPGTGQYPDQIAINTATALGYTLAALPEWTTSLKKRLSDAKDWTSAESALAEIRACGGLLEAGFTVRPGQPNRQGGRPEFVVEANGGAATVEVWTRNLSTKEQKRVSRELGDPAVENVAMLPDGDEWGTVSTGSSYVAPFGPPDRAKPGDSVLTNVIQKIAGIKEREHQADDNRPFVLWIDLQNQNSLGGFDYAHELLPLKSGIRGGVESGGYWHALYGKKGDILLEIQGSDVAANVLLHDGRFNQVMQHGGRTRISGVILSSPTVTVMMENPCPRFRIAKSFRNRLVSLPHFDISLSVMDWSGGLVRKTVRGQRRSIRAVVRSLDATKGVNPYPLWPGLKRDAASLWVTLKDRLRCR
jgi:hypothetical protein